jgi:predicted DNA-binding protein (UPF0251 family)
LSASAPSSHDLSLVAFTINIAESNFRHTQPAAIKHLNDQELEQLLAAVIEEQQRRGKKPPAPEKTSRKRPVEAIAEVTLSPGKLNAVRAAFKAGVPPSKIAKQFGISQSNVRKALASDGPKA